MSNKLPLFDRFMDVDEANQDVKIEQITISIKKEIINLLGSINHEYGIYENKGEVDSNIAYTAPFYGCGQIMSRIYKMETAIEGLDIEQQLATAIERFEPRVTMVEVNIKAIK